jgi:hypothetical protein
MLVHRTIAKGYSFVAREAMNGLCFVTRGS